MFRETDPGVSPLLSLGVKVKRRAFLRDVFWRKILSIPSVEVL